MKTLLRFLAFGVGLLTVVFLSGCSTASAPSTEGSRKSLVLQLDAQGMSVMAEKLIASLLQSDVLDKTPTKPAVIRIGRIVNDTHQVVDTGMFTDRFRASLMQTGKAIFRETEGKTVAKPDWILSGKITETVVISGRNCSRTYRVSMTLSDPNANAIMWADNAEITKARSTCIVGH